jgi:hypothetical protein
VIRWWRWRSSKATTVNLIIGLRRRRRHIRRRRLPTNPNRTSNRRPGQSVSLPQPQVSSLLPFPTTGSTNLSPIFVSFPRREFHFRSQKHFDAFSRTRFPTERLRTSRGVFKNPSSFCFGSQAQKSLLIWLLAGKRSSHFKHLPSIHRIFLILKNLLI